MKKTFFNSAIVLFFFFISCSESGEKTEIKTGNSATTVKEPIRDNTDQSKRTSISVGSGGTGVKHKNTDVKVDRSGIKVGTKDVKVEINR